MTFNNKLSCGCHCVQIRIKNDLLDEQQETFNATLTLHSTDADRVTIDPDVTQIVIKNKDSKLKRAKLSETSDIIVHPPR